MLTGTFTRDTGWMTRPTGKAGTGTWMEPRMKGTGRRTNNTDSERRSGPMAVSTRETMCKGENRAEANSHGPMGAITKGSFGRICAMGKVTYTSSETMASFEKGKKKIKL